MLKFDWINEEMTEWANDLLLVIKLMLKRERRGTILTKSEMEWESEWDRKKKSTHYSKEKWKTFVIFQPFLLFFDENLIKQQLFIYWKLKN